MRLPITCDHEKRSDVKTDFIFFAEYTLYKNSKRIECKISVDNKVKNHRMRVVFPTYINSQTFATAMPYDMQTWQVNKGEHTYDCEPFSPVVVGQGLININDGKDSFSIYANGLYEYEVADREDRAISVTPFRSFPKETFFLQSNLAQLQRELQFNLAIDFDCCKNSELIKMSRSFRVGLLSKEIRENKGQLTDGKIIEITGNAVLSSFRMRDLITGKPTVRIYDVDGFSEGEIRFPKNIKTARRVKQNGTVIGDVEYCQNKIKYKLKDREIATFEVEFNENGN
jgi:hypothetical protein